MNPAESRPVPLATLFLAAAGLGLLLSGCMGTPDLDAGNDPLVVTETSPVSFAEEPSPQRRAAVAAMRARGEAGEAMPYPDVFQAGQMVRLAAREEPRPVAGVDAIELELAAIARRQQSAITPGEIAALKARAAELRRLAASAQAASRSR